jgi:hypothetical protein
MQMMLWRRMLLLAVLTVIVVAGVNPRALAQSSGTAEPTREQLDLQISIMRDYIDKLEQQTKGQTENVDPTVLQAYRQAQLKQYESLITQADLINQAFYEQRIILRISIALVALVVISGVFFSAVQLWQSLRVAGATMSSDLEISASKVRLTSSVIGVVVLVISLAFFYIFFSTNLKIERAGAQSPITQGAPK